MGPTQDGSARKKSFVLFEKNVFFLKVTDFGANPPLGNTLPPPSFQGHKCPKRCRVKFRREGDREKVLSPRRFLCTWEIVSGGEVCFQRRFIQTTHFWRRERDGNQKLIFPMAGKKWLPVFLSPINAQKIKKIWGGRASDYSKKAFFPLPKNLCGKRGKSREDFLTN